jgi:PAS domain S-box-containing protein
MSQFKILIVEDDAIESLDIRRRLESLGYEVPYVASRGHDAIEKAIQFMPDLVLMDISLKGDMDGIEAAQEIIKLNIPVIYLTAHSDEATVQKAKLTEPYGYIIKPYDPNELKFTLELAIYKSKNDKKLKESEKVSNALLNASNDSLFLVDTSGKILAVNNAVAERLGVNKEEMIGSRFNNFIKEDLAESRWEYFLKSMETKKPVEFEDDIDGIYFHHRISPIMEDNEVAKLAVFSQDISEKKLAEAELIKSEKKYRAIFDHAGSATLIFDNNGIIVMVNSEWEKVSGYPREEVEGKMKWMELVHPDYRDLMIEYSKKRASGDSSVPSRYESCFIKKNGKILEMYVSVVPMPGNEQWLASALDITDLKKTQKELSTNEERLKLALHGANAAIFDWYTNTGEAYFPPEYYTLFGYEPGDFPATYEGWSSIIHPDDREKTILSLQNQIEEKLDQLQIEYRVIGKNNSIKWILGIAKGVEFDEEGYITRLIGMNLDITERKVLEEELEFTQYSMEHATDAIIWITSDARINFVNQAACESLGYSKEELTSMTVFDIDPDFPPGKWEKHWEDIKNGRIKKVETIHRRKNGERISVDISINYLKYNGIEYNCAFVRDISEQNEIDNILKESQRKLETLMSNLPGMAYRCKNDPQWTMEFVSEGSVELTGYLPEDLIDNKKLSYASLIHPEDQQKVWGDAQRALDKREPFNLNYRIITADSKIKFVSENGMGIFSENGELLALEGFISDISEQKKAEEELIESKEYLGHIIDSIADPVFVKDREHRWTLINNAFCEFVGHSREELLGKSDYDFFPPNEADVFWEKDEEVFESGTENVNEEEITNSDGNTRAVITKKTAYMDKQGETYLVGVIRDVTDLKNVEKTLKEQYDFLQYLMDSIPSPIFYKDADYRYQGCNKAFEEIFDLSKESLIGKTVYDINPPELADKFHQKDQELFNNPGTQTYEAPVRYGDDSLHNVLFVKNTFNDQNGNLAGMIGLMSDITQLKNAEEALRSSEREYKEVFENINTAVAVYEAAENGENFIIKDFNRAGAKIENVTRKEVIGKKVTDVFPGVEEFGILEVFKRVRETGQPEKFPVSFYQDERISGWRENYIYKLPSGEVIAVYDDLTHQKQAEEEIELNQTRLKSLVKILQYNSQSVQDLLDYALEEAIKLTKSKIGYIYHYYPDKKEFILNTWSEGVMKECTVKEVPEVYALEKTGIWGEAVRQRKSFILNNFQTPNPLKKGYPQGHAPLYKYMTLPVFSRDDIVAVVGVANKEADYTETDLLQLELLMDAVWKIVDRQKAEEALVISETEYKAIFENTGTATAISEDNMVLSLANEEFAQLTGYSKEEIENKLAWTEFFVEDQLEKMKKYHRMRRIDPEKAPKNYESQVIDKERNIKDVYMTVSLIPNTKKSLVSVLDITERKQSRKRLVRELRIDKALANIYSPIISPDSTIEDISVAILEEARKLTDSEQGYVSSIDPKNGDNIIHSLTRMMPDCQVSYEKEVVRFSKEPDGTYNGLWGHSLNTGKSFFTNAPQSHQSSKGVPEGHITLKNFLSVPVFLGSDLVGQVALANTHRDYTQKDIDAIERIAEFYALAIHSKDAEKEIKNSLEEKETLLREIHHRVKNNMQIISSLLNLQKYDDSEKDPVELIEDSQNRIKTMSIVHELLYQSEKLSKVDLKLYIEKLTRYLFEQFSTSPRRITLRTDLEENYLNIETAVPCCLIVNELVSNSLKHAFPSGDGEIRISFHKLNGQYELIVQDNGIGLPPDFDLEKTLTLGLYLVNSLVNQIDGTLEIKSEGGVEFKVIFEELIYKKRV